MLTNRKREAAVEELSLFASPAARDREFAAASRSSWASLCSAHAEHPLLKRDPGFEFLRSPTPS
jgi:hypothetical protein